MCAGATMAMGLSLLKTGTKVTRADKEIDQQVVIGFGALLTAVGAVTAIQTLSDIWERK
jgi:hypothetical protein